MTGEKIYTVAEVATMTGKTERAIKKMLDRGTLGHILGYVEVDGKRHGKRQRLIPAYDLSRSGLTKPKPTRMDRGVPRLIGHMKHRPDQPFTTHTLAVKAGLKRQEAEHALATLVALGHVRKSIEPPPTGTGRPRNVWRWTAEPQRGARQSR
jgi:hypothetical protein